MLRWLFLLLTPVGWIVLLYYFVVGVVNWVRMLRSASQTHQACQEVERAIADAEREGADGFDLELVRLCYREKYHKLMDGL
jgi:hypothetical protein